MEIEDINGNITFDSYYKAIKFGSYPVRHRYLLNHVTDDVIPIKLNSDLWVTQYKELYYPAPIQNCTVISTGMVDYNDMEISSFAFLVNRSKLLYLLQKVKHETSTNFTGTVSWIPNSADRNYLIYGSQLKFNHIFLELSNDGEGLFLSLRVHFEEEQINPAVTGLFELYQIDSETLNTLIDLLELDWESTNNKFKDYDKQ